MTASVIPSASLDQHMAILGKTGSGKTYTAKGAVEQLVRAHRQTCVLDPTGAWWGLRLAADGKGRGFDVVLLGGAHADIPLAERSGAAVARLVTEQGASVVIDTSGFKVGEYTRWFIDFAGTLYTSIRAPLHLVIDEAHYFMPQSGGGSKLDADAAKMLHAGNRLMSGGRSRGVRGMLITQRPAKLHKDSLTCADTLIAMRVMAPQDRQAIKDWIDGAGDPAKGKAVLDSLASLKRGEGWVWYPEGGHLERVMFPKIETYDSSAAPVHGAKAGPKVAEIKLDEIKGAMAEAVREAEANDPKLLRKKIAELEAELRKKPGAVKADHSADAGKMVERATAEGMGKVQRALQPLVKQLRIVAEFGPKRVQAIEGLIAAYRADAEQLERTWAAIDELARSKATPSVDTPAVSTKPVIPARSVNRPPADAGPSPNGRSGVSAAQRVLDAMGWWNAAGRTTPTREQVAFVTGYAHIQSRAFREAVSELIDGGMVTMPVPGCLELTLEGAAKAARVESPTTTEELHQRIRDTLDDRATREIFDVLTTVDSIDRQELAARTNYAHIQSRPFREAVSRLVKIGVAELPAGGQVALSPLVRSID